MPKILIYITTRAVWTFLFYGLDFHENRAHVHVGLKGRREMCKIWLEPEVSLAKAGDFTPAQQKQALAITQRHREALMAQWERFKRGEKLNIIKIKE